MTTTTYKVVGDSYVLFQPDTDYVEDHRRPKPTFNIGPIYAHDRKYGYPFNPVTTNGLIVGWNWSPATD